MAPWYHAGPGSDGALLDTEKLPRRERVTQGDRLMKAGLILSVDNLPVSAFSLATGINKWGRDFGLFLGFCYRGKCEGHSFSRRSSSYDPN